MAKLSAKNDLESICSVTEMARAVGLSRARFHQLIGTGVFPPPVYCIRTRRPMYPSGLQQARLRIRSTGVGFNGHPILFNAPRRSQHAGSRRLRITGHGDLAGVLEALGIRVAPDELAHALEALYPEGLPEGPLQSAVIDNVMRYLQGHCPKRV